MRIQPVEATGGPLPNFVVTPETDVERVLLRAFIVSGHDAKMTLDVKNWGYRDGKFDSFLFGWNYPPCEEQVTEERA